ncbi:hypothetical protein [Thermophagus xiamenensis]|nr:hypothetical protein [Thermophagus xiamenensis]
MSIVLTSIDKMFRRGILSLIKSLTFAAPKENTILRNTSLLAKIIVLR